MKWAGGAVMLLGLLLLGSVCGPNAADFFARLYYCDSTVSGSELCGKSRNGELMICHPGRQLGGRDFCVERCPAQGAPEGFQCLSTGAMLRTCRPSDDERPAQYPNGACNHAELRCLRTDLTADRGVCVAGGVCSTNKDCDGSVRSVCASSILQAVYGGSPGLRTDHLYCVDVGCQARGVNCPTGEACLPNLVGPSSSPPDLCVPHCDSSLNCPPGHYCYRNSGPASPSVCLAGLSSYRCQSSSECLVGSCMPAWGPINSCTLPCESDPECWGLEMPGAPQMCGRAADGRKACMALDLFSGSLCQVDQDCPQGTVCTRYSPYQTNVKRNGYCLPPCGPGGECETRGGVPHTCFDFLEQPVCYPAKYGLYCSRPDVCVGGAGCNMAKEMGPDDTFVTRPLCTIACETDADCTKDHGARVSGAYCEQGFCVIGRRGGRLCQRDVECGTRACRPSDRPGEDQQGIRRCTYQPGAAP
jgi:hypothetical protein